MSAIVAIVCRHSDLYCLSVILRQINSDSSPIFPHHIPEGIPPQRLTRIKISVCTRRIYLLIVGIKYLQCKTRLLTLRMTRVLQYSSIFQEQQIIIICINSICIGYTLGLRTGRGITKTHRSTFSDRNNSQPVTCSRVITCRGSIHNMSVTIIVRGNNSSVWIGKRPNRPCTAG